jgi:carbon-monoxide dehydrogenase iron sulfur subunit
LAVCPTRAIYRAADRAHIVLLDERKCIACGMCAMVCPFDVITYHASPRAPDRPMVATKCDDCIDRQRAGRVPACVEVCKVDALVFGDINELVRSARRRSAPDAADHPERAEARPAPPPALLDAWRAWAAQVTRLNAEATPGA